MAEAVASDAATAPGVFSRKSSGLIRVGSTLDVFIFNVGLVSVGIAIAYNQYYGPSLYPGAQPWVSTLLAAGGMLFVAAAFYCWSGVFPRSGGGYVFLSPTINPGVAVVMSLIETVILLYSAALAAWLTGGQLSLGSLVGFVTLFGITLRNSIMMISHYEHLVSVEGMEWGLEAALRGASERLAPILMTALVTGLGLLPLALGSGDPGREIEGPMAIVILGGLITSTLLNLLVLPTLSLRYGSFEKSNEAE